jgi:hypothetical protein
LTPDGRRQFEIQSSAHEDWIAELFAQIPPADRDALHRHLAAVKAGVRLALMEETV